MRLTRGDGIMNHSFLDYPIRISSQWSLNLEGVATFYAMKNAEDRGVFFITPTTKVYKGMIVENTTGPKTWNSTRQNN